MKQKKGLGIFLGIFLVSMLFVPPSMPFMVPEAEASSEIPNWVKNNAGWWEEGKINDPSFVKGIESHYVGRNDETV